MSGRRRRILVLEAGSRIYKEPIVRSLHELSDVDLYFASGLTSTIPIEWVKPYSSGLIVFSYNDDSLYTALDRFCIEKAMRFDGILTYVEPSVHVANELQRRLGLPVISARRGKSLRNKWQMRRLLQAAGVRQPTFIGVSSIKELRAATKTARFPVVVKPTEMMASLGVALVRNHLQLEEAFHRALDADFWDEDLRTLYGDIAKEVLIEEYIQGPEYSVETVVSDGRPHLLGITKKYSSASGRFDEVAHRFPAHDLSQNDVRKISALVEASHGALEFKNTLTHTELRMRDGVPILMEINCRLAGGLISTLIERSLGVNIGTILAATATGQPVDIPRKTGSAHEIRFFNSSIDGMVVSIPPPPPPRANLCEFISHVKPGDILFRNGLTGVSRLGHAIHCVGGPNSPTDASLRRLESSFLVKPAICFRSIPKTRDRLALFVAGEEDLPALTQIEQACWPERQATTPKTTLERIRANEQSTLIAYSLSSGLPLASLVGVPLKEFNALRVQKWDHYASLAINEKHLARAREAKNVYVISISSVPTAPRGTGSAFLMAALDWYQKQGKIQVAYTIRIPNFSKHFKQGVNIDEYYDGLRHGRYREDIYQLAVRHAGGTPCGIVSEYYDDPDSLNCGITVSHKLG
ncbi:MAG: hypothetical protein A2V88_05605 [Elusimicrobia bacterium RBG_16_66_12]|nr:MAG: hypothetical protein A2V88_05605 [Elusimicrobia bacterium RBG_16_66_12]